MAFVDFREVKRQASIHQTAQFLHLEMHQIAPGWHRAWCPRCEAHTLMIVPLWGGYFMCVKGRVSGDQLALVSHVKNIGVKDAAIQLGKHFGMELPNGHRKAESTHRAA